MFTHYFFLFDFSISLAVFEIRHSVGLVFNKDEGNNVINKQATVYIGTAETPAYVFDHGDLLPLKHFNLIFHPAFPIPIHFSLTRLCLLFKSYEGFSK